MIIAIKTDSPTVELLLLDRDGAVVTRDEWLAERRLALELLGRLDALLARGAHSWSDVDGLIVYQGPGSFTGLRIGITVMNTAAYAQSIPIVGTSGDEWLRAGVMRLSSGDDDHIVLPEYGAPARITTPRK